MKAWAYSDRGKVRKQNQDAFYISNEDAKPFFLVVCDGMGGAKAGNVASELAVKVFSSELEKYFAGDFLLENITDAMKSAAYCANTAVYELSRANSNCQGMGTTLVAAVVYEGTAYLINIGDSRAYHVSKDDMYQITRDHSVVEDMVERGDITREESRSHPNKNLITRAVGTVKNIEADSFTVKLNSGDCLVLCTDGLTNQVADWEIHYEIAHNSTAGDSGIKLMSLALERGAPDNVTVAILKA